MLRTTAKDEWKPKQCVEVTPSVFKELTNNASQGVAAHVLTLVPPFLPGSVIHDNACGDLVVTSEILKTLPRAVVDDGSISIRATDLSPAMVSFCTTKASQNGWSHIITASLMAIQDLTFPANTFTHSFTNFVIFALSEPDAAKAAAHIHRTLQPGGTAVMTCYGDVAHRAILEDLHRSTRGAAEPPLPGMNAHLWADLAYSGQVLEKAGFKAENVRLEKLEIEMRLGELGRWADVLWTLRGRPVGGWEARDEENWEYVTGEIVRRMQAHRDFRWGEDGMGRARAVVNVAVATK